MKLKPINQQVVVVMGASSGIGRATALRFAEKGASVVVAARNKTGLDALVTEIRRKRGTAVAVVADTAHPDEVKRVADRAIAEFGRIDTWAHVAGVALWSPFELTKPEEMDRVIAVNLLGQMYGALVALPHLRAQGRGALIHVSSVEADVAFPWNSSYAASKHGMVGFLDALRLELEREGARIAVVNIKPATIDTPIFRNALTRLGVQPRGAGPVYAPEIVANAIVAAAEHPVHDLMVGGSAALLSGLKRRAPRVLHSLLLTPLGFEAQLTKTLKSADAPNNLFAPTPDQNLGIHGDLHAEEKKTSPFTRLQTSAPMRLARGITRPVTTLVARAIEMLWATRYGQQLQGLKLRSGAGAGLPEIVQKQLASAGILMVPRIEGPGLRRPIIAPTTGQGTKTEKAQSVKVEKGQHAKLEKGHAKAEKGQHAKLEKAQSVKLEKGQHAKLEKAQSVKLEKGQHAKLEKGQHAKLEKGQSVKAEKSQGVEIEQGQGVKAEKGQGVKAEKGTKSRKVRRAKRVASQRARGLRQRAKRVKAQGTQWAKVQRAKRVKARKAQGAQARRAVRAKIRGVRKAQSARRTKGQGSAR
ncbi:Putative short-chain dehydrogenase [Minicystis rosea]|nr:Putative short-chain dehydrogenase [Minicystis rosea]